MTATEPAPGLPAQRRAAALMMLSVAMIALSFVVAGTATSVLRVLSLVPMAIALSVAVSASPMGARPRRTVVAAVVVGFLVAGALAYGLVTAGTA